MDLRLEKANSSQLIDCVETLSNSLLGKYYFEKSGSCESAIKEGLVTDTLFVAVTSQHVAGFFFYLPNGAFHSFPYLHLLAVKEEYRGQGVGKFLLQSWEGQTSRDKLFLCVSDFNTNAKIFYEKNGYRQVGMLPDLYRKDITEYLMMKDRSSLLEKA